MPTVTRASGVRLDVPDSVRVEDAAVRRAPRRAARRGARAFEARSLPLAPAAAAAEQAEVLAALQQQELQLVDAVQLETTAPPAAGPAGARRAAGEPEPPRVTLSLDLAPDQGAVVLVEQDGYYAWKLPLPEPAAPAAAMARGPAAGAPRQAVFQLVLDTRPLPGAAAGAAARGPLQTLALAQARAFVFRFATPLVLGSAMKFLERDVRPSLVNLADHDPTRWAPLADEGALPLPADRPARCLLFLHGTFSSTLGSFGALAGSPWGEDFLRGARATYDLVLGFDHPTLSADPADNAADLLAHLRRLPWSRPPQIDVVAYSRGGLVFRALEESLLPHSDWRPTLGRAIFVAVPNAGTTLAGSPRWPVLIDHYTNIAVAAARALGWLPQARAVSPILQESLRTLGALVKYVAMGATADDGVPGLAAMNPTGSFITTLNQLPAGDPSADATRYAAITAEFEPTTDPALIPKELPARLMLQLLDEDADALMGGPNDLVVDTASMTALGAARAGRLEDRYEFGRSPQVYHTCYFVYPEVANALTRWLGLDAPRAAPPLLPPRQSIPRPTGRSAAPPALDLGQIPAAVDVDVLAAPASGLAGAVGAAIAAARPSYLVVRRGGDLDYAFPAEEALERLTAGRPDRSVDEVFDLHESDASDPLPLSAFATGGVSRGSLHLDPTRAPTARRHVVLDENDGLVGVIPEAAPAADVTALREFASRAAAPRTPADYVMARRVLPTYARPPAAERSGSRAAPRRGALVTCSFDARCDVEMVLDLPTVVEVTVSREALERAAGRTSAQGTGQVDPAAKLVVEVIPRAEFEHVGERRAIIDAPAPDAPWRGYFLLRPRQVGEAEIWVLASQRQTSLVLLKLRPRVVAARAEGGS